MTDEDLIAALTGERPKAAPRATSAAPDISELERKYSIPSGLYARLLEKGEASKDDSVSPKGAIGRAQLMPDTAKELGVDPNDPAQNVEGGARYFAQQYAKFGDWRLAAAAYNAGPGAVEKHGGVPPYDETQAYVARIFDEPDGPSDKDIMAALVGAPEGEDAGAKPGDEASKTGLDEAGRLIFADTGKPATPAQDATYKTMLGGNAIQPDQPAGHANNPWVQRAPEDSFKKGEFFIATDGTLQRMPGGEDMAVGFGGGMWQGGGDVANSLATILPFADDSEWGQRAEAQRLIYEASGAGDNLSAKFGRFTGQVAGSTPFVVAGGSGLGALGGTVARAAPAAAPAAEFVTGQAGGNLLIRGGSLATAGAAEGAAATALVSDATDLPMQEQMATGALFGSILRPAIPALGGVKNKLLGVDTTGAIPYAAQKQAYDAAQGLPVPVPMRPGQLSLSPAEQMAENNLLRGGKGDAAAQVMREHAAAQQAALRGNVEAITTGMTKGPLHEANQGAAMVSDKLNQQYDAAKDAVNAAYAAARAASDGAYLPAAERGVMTANIREAVREVEIGGSRVEKILDGLDQSPTSSTFTPRDIFDVRAKLTSLRGSADGPEAVAAGKAVGAIDAYIDDALTRDLFSGDPALVDAWRDAISKRREMGKLFEGGDLINRLTERVRHGESSTLKVAPEDAANLIFGRSKLGFVGRKDLTRDLTRLRDVLGADSPEWGALRGEAFMRIARAGEGAPEGGTRQFSGQNFFKAWDEAKATHPQIIRTLFTPEEREVIDQFAEIAQRATTPVKGGDNASNSGVYIVAAARKALENLGTMTGGAVGSVGGPGGAAVGAGVGRAFDTFMRDIGAVVKARKITSGAPPKDPSARVTGNKLIDSLVGTASRTAPVVGANNLVHAGP